MATGKYAVAIDDRTGFKHPWKDMVKEPGTNWIVHKSESDGQYSLVNHPQNFVRLNRADNVALAWSRPDLGDVTANTSALDYLYITSTETIFGNYGNVTDTIIYTHTDYGDIA